MTRFDHYAQGTPSYVELATSDPAAAADFYAALFGWTVETVDMGDAGAYWTTALDGDRVAGISGQVPGGEGEPSVWTVYLAADDVDAVAAKVGPAGGRVVAGPFDVGPQGRMAMVVDPAGVPVSLWQAGEVVGTTLANVPGTPVWNELTCDDAATGFYTDVLGVTWETEDFGGVDYRAMKVDGRTVGGAVPLQPAGSRPRWNVYFLVADVAEGVDRVTDLGGSVVLPTTDMPGVGRMALVADPQGATFWIMQAPGDAGVEAGVE